MEFTRHKIYRLNGGRIIYPFRRIRFGDWVIAPRDLAKKASAAAYMYGKRHRLYFRCRKFGTQGRVKIIRLSLYHTDRGAISAKHN